MDRPRRVFHGEDRAQRASSFSAADLQGFVRRMGYVLSKVHELVMTRVIADADVELAEEINDELKPLVDALINFEVPRG